HQPAAGAIAHGGRHRTASAAVPVSNGAVEAAGDDEALVGRERQRRDRPALAAQREPALAGDRVPYHDGAALAAEIARRGVALAEAGDQRLAVARHGERGRIAITRPRR